MIKKLEFSLKIINQFFILRNKRIVVGKTGTNRIIFCLSKFSKFKMKLVSVEKQSAVSAVKPSAPAKLILHGSNQGNAHKINL